MHDIAVRRPPGSAFRSPVFDPMASPAVVEAGKRLVAGRLTPREFDAVVEHERAVWERRTTAPVATVSPRR